MLIPNLTGKSCVSGGLPGQPKLKICSWGRTRVAMLAPCGSTVGRKQGSYAVTTMFLSIWLQKVEGHLMKQTSLEHRRRHKEDLSHKHMF